HPPLLRRFSADVGFDLMKSFKGPNCRGKACLVSTAKPVVCRPLSRIVLALTLVLFLVMQAAPPALAAPRRQEVFDPTKVQRASVYVMQVYSNPLGQSIISCVGSGTVVSA